MRTEVRHAVNPEVPSEAYVAFNANVNPESTNSLLTVLTQLSQAGTKRVVLCMSSGGGQVATAIGLMNLLPQLPIELVTHNIAQVGSAGNLLFLCGAKRFANQNALFFVHRPTWSPMDGREFMQRL
jgi:ATP-dependent protease ClpP protease subunit